MANRESVKVVLIDTQYVKTDATSFKSIVQSLTGKDSSVEWINDTFTGDNNYNTEKRKKSTRRSVVTTSEDTIKSDAIGKEDLNSVFSRGLSFKDFDRMLMEMPPLEDLQHWLSNDYVID